MAEKEVKFGADDFKYVIDTILSYANDAKKGGDDFSDGKRFGYYEVLSTIQADLEMNGFNPEDFGLGFDPMEYMGA